MSTPVLTYEEKQKLVADFARGETLAYVAAKNNLRVHEARAILNAAGVFNKVGRRQGTIRI